MHESIFCQNVASIPLFLLQIFQMVENKSLLSSSEKSAWNLPAQQKPCVGVRSRLFKRSGEKDYFGICQANFIVLIIDESTNLTNNA